MQPKVSMVMPCYNKAAWIGGMFDTILAQNWDNMELVLVNDGSTDNTRGLIEKYLPKFRERGFEVVVIDQENLGVAAAVRNGLLSITGDYVCQVDADDELDPAYVGTLAGWLRDHGEYDWVVCDMLVVVKDKPPLQKNYFRLPEKIIDSQYAESYLLGKITTGIHEYMVRVEYLRRSRMLDVYYHDHAVTQEPQYIFPLFFAEGRLKHIPEPLYRYIPDASLITASHKHSFEKTVSYNENRYLITKRVFEGLNLESSRKSKFLALAAIRKFLGILQYAATNGDSSESVTAYTVQNNLGWVEFVNSFFEPSPNLPAMDFWHQNLLFTAVADNILGFIPRRPETVKGRIIAWGMGARSRKLLPRLKGTCLEPVELWDLADDGEAVKRPDPDHLSEDDMVIIFPTQHIEKEIYSRIRNTGCNCMLSSDIVQYLSTLIFPKFYDGSTAFAPV